jgi:hypothetical protein
MKDIEREVRENIDLENQCLKKLDFIRNELLPFYGNLSLKEVEESLWDQYLKFHNKVTNYFKDE